MKSHTMLALVGLGTLAIGSAAPAAMVTWRAEGNISAMIDPSNLTGGATAWSWTYTFNSNAVDQDPDPEFGIYAIGDWELTLGTLTVTGTETRHDVQHNVGGDAYFITAHDPPPPVGWSFFFPTVIMGVSGGGVFDSDALPAMPPNPLDFNSIHFQVEGGTESGDLLNLVGDVKTISVVPAPGVLPLLGLAGLMGTRRRRR